MASDNKDSTPLPVGGIAVLLVLAAGIFVKHQYAFESSRPNEASIKAARTQQLQDVDARLWEDPFAAVARYRYGEGDGSVVSAATHPSSLLRDKLAEEKKSVQYLGVMVYAGPYAEDVEIRRRTRYAVLAGLEASGYVPENNDKVGFFQIAADTNSGDPNGDIVPFEFFDLEVAADGAETEGKARRVTTGKKRADKILLLWLAEEKLWTDQPATKSLASLVTVLGIPQKPVVAGKAADPDLTIIGPATSTGLKSLIAGMGLKCGENEELVRGKSLDVEKRKVAFYSPASTAIPRDLLPDLRCLPQTGSAQSNDPRSSERLLGRLFRKDDKVSMVRTINNDSEVARALAEELKLRGIASGTQRSRDPDHILLVSEWDTDYGRKLPERFIEAACMSWGGEDCEKGRPENPPWVTRWSYLRGLDGGVATAADKRAGKEKPDKDNKGKDKDKDAGPSERADGSSQYDYLRRLARSVEGRMHVTAVGVLGSDPYDKLLVLQALRAQFPDAVFFTTDMDARLLQQNQREWTRNLLVGSGFGLELAPEIQGRTPPFRDTYQTATFLAVKLALDQSIGSFESKQKKLDDWLPFPRVYEIGRTQAFALAPLSEPVRSRNCAELKNCGDVRPPLPFYGLGLHWREVLLRASPWILLSGTTLALLYIYVWPIRRVMDRIGQSLFRNWSARIAAFLLAVGAWLLVRWMLPGFVDPQGEPFAWVEGISMWPTELIRILTFVLTVCFIVRTLQPTELERGKPGTFVSAGPAPGKRYLAIYSWHRFYHDALEKVDVAELWREFKYLEGLWPRVIRVLVSSALYFIALSCIWSALGPSAAWHRGAFARHIDLYVLLGCVITFIVLLFLVVDTIRLGFTMICNLSTGRSIYPSQTLAAARFEFGIDKESFVEPLCDLLDIRLIGAYTERISRCIYYPFAVLTLLIVARSQIFDDWHTPPALFLTFLFAFSIILACAVVLQRASANAKRDAVERLTGYLAQARGESGSLKPYIVQLEMMLDEVRDARRGAFVSFFQQPIFKAFFVPAGGFGGIQLIEYALTGLSL